MNIRKNKLNSKCLKSSGQKGFTLLEVIITISILSVMMIAVSSLLKGSFEVREGLSNNGKINHRINVAMRAVSDDLEHALYFSLNDPIRSTPDRTWKTYFEIGKNFKGENLRFTMNNYRPQKYNAKESDMAFVVYEVKESKDTPGRNHLYRGYNSKVPSSFKEDPPMKIVAKNIKNMKVEYWNGDSWVQDKWSTSSGTTRDKLPHMIRLTLDAWTEDVMEGDSSESDRNEDTIQISTIVYLKNASRFDELKTKSSSMRL